MGYPHSHPRHPDSAASGCSAHLLPSETQQDREAQCSDSCSQAEERRDEPGNLQENRSSKQHLHDHHRAQRGRSRITATLSDNKPSSEKEPVLGMKELGERNEDSVLSHSVKMSGRFATGTLEK